MGASFDLTPNEFETASIKGDSYYILLVYLDEEDIIFRFLKNPTKSSTYEEITKVINYRFSQYDGKSYSLTYEELGLE